MRRVSQAECPPGTIIDGAERTLDTPRPPKADRFAKRIAAGRVKGSAPPRLPRGLTTPSEALDT